MAQIDLARSPFIIHARNAHDLREFLVSDIARQIEVLENRAKNSKATESAKIAYVLGELRLMQDFWSRVNIVGGRKAKFPLAQRKPDSYLKFKEHMREESTDD